MKFTIHMKTPDAIECAIENVMANYYPLLDNSDYETEEQKLYELEHDLRELLSKWFKYGECVAIEIDTDTKTATVLEI